MCVICHSHSTLLNIAALLYPLLTLYCITVTGNHFPLDALVRCHAHWFVPAHALLPCIKKPSAATIGTSCPAIPSTLCL